MKIEKHSWIKTKKEEGFEWVTVEVVKICFKFLNIDKSLYLKKRTILSRPRDNT